MFSIHSSNNVLNSIWKSTLLTFVIAATVPNAGAQVIKDDVAELKGIDVIEHLGEIIDLDLNFTDETGAEVRLDDYFGNEKPVLLILGYYECPMLCNLVANGVTESIKKMGWLPGEKFQMVTVSINPDEGSPLAMAKKKNYLESLKMNPDDSGWVFLTGEQSQSVALAEAVGFKYYYDESQKQYAHPAVVFILSENGKITRYLYGLEYKPNDLKLALLEASEGKIGSTVDRLILYCFHYDPDANGYVVFAGNLMRLGGVVIMICLSLFLGGLWLKERRRRNNKLAASKV